MPPPAPVTTATRESNETGGLAVELQETRGIPVRVGLERRRQRRRQLVMLSILLNTD